MDSSEDPAYGSPRPARDESSRPQDPKDLSPRPNDYPLDHNQWDDEERPSGGTASPPNASNGPPGGQETPPPSSNNNNNMSSSRHHHHHHHESSGQDDADDSRDGLPPKRRRSNDFNANNQDADSESTTNARNDSRASNMDGGGTMSLLVRHLKFATNPTTVRKYFEQCGEVKDVYLPLDFERGSPRGFGFVEFARRQDAERALRLLDNTDLDGSVISISVAQHGRKSPSTMRQRSSGNRRRHRRGGEPYGDYDRSGSPIRRPPRSYRDGPSRGGYDSFRDGPSRGGGDSYRGRADDDRGGRYEYDRGYRDYGYGGSSRNWDHGPSSSGRDSAGGLREPRSYSGRRSSR